MAMLPWWIHYPYVNNEIQNLDWLLQISNENTDMIKNFIGINTIKYADPILWDITSQYEANTIVVDPQTGDAYISTKAVPYGVALSNDGYWTRIYNYASEIHIFREQIAADEQLSTTATATRIVNDLVFLNGLLYRVTSPMIAGDSYVEGSNCVKTTINAELLRLHTSINSEAQARADADTALGGRIDNEAQARADADTALGGRIDSLASGVTTLNNEVELLRNKKIILIGDSYGLSPTMENSWVTKLINNLGLTVGTNVFYYSEGGASFGGNDGFPLFQNMINSISVVGAELSEITDVYICGGYNDIQGVHGATSASTKSGINLAYTNTKARFPNAKLHIGFIGGTLSSSIRPNISIAIRDYIEGCAAKGIHYLKNTECIMHNDLLFNSDGIHPTAEGSDKLSLYIALSMLDSCDVISNFVNATFTPESGVSLGSFFWVMGSQQCNHIVTASMFYTTDQARFTFSTPVDIANEILLGEFSDTYLFGDDFDTASFTMTVDAGGTDYLSNVPARFSIRNRKLYVKVFGTLTDMNGLVIHGRHTFSCNIFEN